MIWIYKDFIIYTIAFKLVYIYHYIKKYDSQYIKNINKNIFNNLLINVSCCTRILLFQKLTSHPTTPALVSELESAPVLPR